MMNFKISLVLIFSLIKMLQSQSQNIDSIINEKVHLTTEEDMEISNAQSEDENERIKSSYSNTYQQQQQHQQTTDLTEIQQLQSSDSQTKKIHHSNYPTRPVFSSNNINSISKTSHMLSKPRPTITHLQNTGTFIESETNQHISDQQQQIQQQQTQQQQIQQHHNHHHQQPQQQQQQQYDNEMDSGSFTSYPSTPSSFSNIDSQRNDNWPFAGSSQQNLITSKPNSAEFTVNSNTLNFTNQGLDNLKIFNITSTNHIIPQINTFANIIPAVNYNQQDPLSPMQIIANPIQNLVLRSFENFRRLIKNCNTIEAFLITKMNLPKYTKLRTLDPLEFSENFYFDHRDPKSPLLGKLKFTLENVQVSGLSTFKTESLSNQGRTMFFKHRIPQLDFHANYTIDYHLFDEIPLLISKGSLKSSISNAYIKGSFTVLPDILNVWFKIANLNLSSSEDLDVQTKVYPIFNISDRFRIERSTLNKLNAAIKNIMPNIVEYFKLTYSKAIEMKIV